MAGIGNHPYLVHYVLPYGPHAGDCRPAAVTRDWGGCHNLQVFTDGENDGLGDDLAILQTSVEPSQTATPGTWHYARECDTATAAQAEAVKASAEAAVPVPTTPQSGSGPSDSSGDPGAPTPGTPDGGSDGDSLDADPRPNPWGGEGQ